MAAVSLSGVHKRYDGGPAVVRDVSLEIDDGEFCVFIGPSGCGKSTLLRMVAGLEDISEGELRIGGERVNERAPSERNVAMVFQNYALYPHMDVRQNIAFGLGLAGLARDEIERRVERIARTLRIEALLERKPRALSGGQRQRVAIGRALVRDPGVFLFDEPLSNLDAALCAQTRVEIANLHRRYARASTIYVTHDQIEAMTLADKIVLLHTGEDVQRHGSVAQVGAPLELYAAPRNLFVAGFIGAPRMNFAAGVVEAVGPAGVTLRTTRGDRLAAAVEPGGLQPGAHVTLGVRPEHLALAGGDAGEGVLPGRVQWVERLGDVTYAHLDVGAAQPFVIRLDGGSPVAVGATARLHLAPQACHLFDAEGMALARRPAARFPEAA